MLVLLKHLLTDLKIKMQLLYFWLCFSSSYGLGSGSGSAGSSAIDRYYSFLDDISSPTNGGNHSSSSNTCLKNTYHYSMPNRYSSRYSSSEHSASSSSGASSSSLGYSSSIRSSYGAVSDYQPLSSRYSRYDIITKICM